MRKQLEFDEKYSTNRIHYHEFFYFTVSNFCLFRRYASGLFTITESLNTLFVEQ